MAMAGIFFFCLSGKEKEKGNEREREREMQD
jgi:hypothetical protein